MSFLLGNRNLLTDFVDVVRVNVVIGYCGIFIESYMNFAEWIDNSRMGPGLVDSWILFVLRDTHSDGKALIIKCSCA
jgi:hypothetical protein